MDRDLQNVLNFIESSTSSLETLVGQLVELLGEGGPIAVALGEVHDEINTVARQLDDLKDSRDDDS